MAQPAASDPQEAEALWRQTLTKGHVSHRAIHRMMRLLPGSPRCKICYNPFGGVGGRICRTVGMVPSRKNPRMCALCCERMPAGGAEVEIAVLFADIRGSTALAEELGAAAFAAALNEFYGTATEVLIRHDATVDKLIGDEVMAFFVPGFVGPDYKRSAVAAGRELLGALGYGGASEPRLPVGIGIDAGIAYVGNVGGGDYVDFTALGDPVNAASRIQAAAGAGELLVGDEAFAAVADRYPASEHRYLDAKGKSEPVGVHAISMGSA